MSSQTIIVVLAKTELEIIDCERLLGQFRSDGTADRGPMIPMRLEKYASKTERSGTLVLVGIGTDKNTRLKIVYFSREFNININNSMSVSCLT